MDLNHLLTRGGVGHFRNMCRPNWQIRFLQQFYCAPIGCQHESAVTNRKWFQKGLRQQEAVEGSP